tara:strand:- start:30285 stop:30746 length:462 start_codon:yes stop_codon:yes gene_type:complete
MLAELAAFNAAYAVVKKTIQNTGELTRCAKQIGEIVGIKADLKEKMDRKRSGFMSKLKGQTANDLEEFQALEEIRAAEEQLREVMIWAGRPGLWTDWVNFQIVKRKERKRLKEEERKRNEAILFYTGIAGLTVVLIGGVVGLVYWAKFLGGMQ